MSKVAARIKNWLGIDVLEEDDDIEAEEFVEEQELEPISSYGEKRRERGRGKVVDLPMPGVHNKLIVYRPESYEDTMSIIGNLKARKPIVLNMESIDIDIAQRILDFMSGAVSALGGDIRKISSKIFAVVPADYDIVENSDGIKE
ncbi:MAG: cell division protein SepF [Clostridia bacterium]|nr:cell division protein SepF [Clostridia bacterium]